MEEFPTYFQFFPVTFCSKDTDFFSFLIIQAEDICLWNMVFISRQLKNQLVQYDAILAEGNTYFSRRMRMMKL